MIKCRRVVLCVDKIDYRIVLFWLLFGLLHGTKLLFLFYDHWKNWFFLDELQLERGVPCLVSATLFSYEIVEKSAFKVLMLLNFFFLVILIFKVFESFNYYEISGE